MSRGLIVTASNPTLIVGIVAGRTFLSPGVSPTKGSTTDEATRSASRPMTFTKPKAPLK